MEERDALCAPGQGGAGKWAASSMLGHREKSGDRTAARCSQRGASFAMVQKMCLLGGEEHGGTCRQSVHSHCRACFFTSFLVQLSTWSSHQNSRTWLDGSKHFVGLQGLIGLMGLSHAPKQPPSWPLLSRGTEGFPLGRAAGRFSCTSRWLFSCPGGSLLLPAPSCKAGAES